MIRRLVAVGVPQRQVARDLGIARETVAGAVRSVRPPKYERSPQPTSFSPFEARVRAILVEHPEMPATVVAERVEWTGSITWFRENVRRLRPEHRPLDPADRLTWAAGDAAQCDLWFPPRKIPLEDGASVLLPVLVIVAAHSRFVTARMIPTRKTEELLRLLTDVLRLIRRLAADKTLPCGVPVRQWLLLAYLALPIDLVPDFIPVLGYADDAILVALVLRSVVDRAGADSVSRHWPGTPEGLTAPRRLARLPG